ncbi:MAG: hypothetical protein MJ094_01245 [Saccharofermentans sp.]|nr:hypothetical protein [Saccharofermentans sp.]
MEKVISLCLPYFNKNMELKLYRIADYKEGQFFPIEINPDVYTPKTIKYAPNNSVPKPYKPELRNWELIQYSDTSSSIRSFYYSDVDFYEIVINSENMSQDNDTVIQHLKTGISLPIGIPNNFLLAIDEDADSYRTVRCRLSDFRKKGDKYVLSSNIEDVEHAIHSLSVIFINKNEIIDSMLVQKYWDENGELVNSRYFYCFDKLPEADGELYLYRFEEYLPIYLSRYIKTHSNNIGLSKNAVQNVIAVIKSAMSDRDEQKRFFSVAGYEDVDLFESKLTDYEDIIVAHLTEKDFLDDAITKILTNSEDLQEKYITCAKELWFKQNSEERSAAEKAISEKQNQINTINAKMANLSKEYEQLSEKYNQLNNQYDEVVSATQKSIDNLSSSINEYIINSKIYSSLLPNTRTNIDKDKCSVFVDDSALFEITDKYSVDDLSKAKKILELNLKNTGLNSLFGTVLSHIFINSDSIINSIVVSGIFARSIADAFSYSINGHRAVRIVVSNPSVEYEDIYNSIKKIASKVILVENLCDTCNELVFMSLNKDFSDKIFIFSYESDTSLSLLSKSIWNYSVFLNTDVAINSFVRDCVFKPAIINEDIGKNKCSYQFDIDSDVVSSLQLLKFPRTTIMIISNFFEYVDNCLDNIDTSLFTDSIIAKFCYLYEDMINEDEISSIKNKLSADVKRRYGI